MLGLFAGYMFVSLGLPWGVGGMAHVQVLCTAGCHARWREYVRAPCKQPFGKQCLCRCWAAGVQQWLNAPGSSFGSSCVSCLPAPHAPMLPFMCSACCHVR